MLACTGLALVAGLAYFAFARPLAVTPRLGPASAFRLVDARERPVTHQALAGYTVIYSFFTTAASDRAGQVMAGQLRALQDHMAQDPARFERVRLAAITLDPEQETPGRIAEFAREAGADPSRWVFLTGPPLAVKLTVGSGFGVYYDIVPGGPPVYESRYVLVDGQGVIRGIYPGPNLDVPRLLRDLDRVERESRATGAARLGYEAAHLFLCYPGL